ncbi:hypothetical protein ACFV3F_39240 [Streptomyces sp. NPDC059717]|uniref:hypothetical protein n=1 Tax=Streptomyces sp. NPDC059717 TaxID=3346922 RepID=UPI003674F196
MAARNSRFSLAILRRRRREPEPPEGMNYVRETLAMARARQWYEEEAEREFDDLVEQESGTFGWETFSLLILSGGGILSAVLGILSGATWLAYSLGGVGALCLALIFLRWHSARRGRRRALLLRD